MRKSVFYYKELTPAEVGKTGTHEVYVRLPNYFDYKSFFHQDAVKNGSVLEINFSALDITNGRLNACIEQFRFVYFANSNQEKRLPGLGPLFKKYDIQSGDIFFLESREENGKLSFEFKFIEKGSIMLQPSQIYFSDEYEDEIGFEKPLLIDNSFPLQQIFYGAPGTGKSHEVNKLTAEAEKDDRVFRTTFHPDSDYSTFVGAYKPTMKENIITKNGVETKEEQIVYRFVPQAFTKAYTAAWNTNEEVFLIIEEINRGNCAQIFGDLFQLLDRKNGASQYPVDADTDLADYIAKELKDSSRPDIPANVKEGKKLVLPSNLYIWATMNTSDQSLFPIDSAFKRRWDWKYMKIKDHRDQDYKVKIGEEVYDWYDFIDNINQIIASMTSSADKQLGYFFCKADDAGIISEDTFVAKVIFYLWNDVFKDYGFEDTSLFTFTEVVNGKEETRELTFPDFYDIEGEKVNEVRLKDFIDRVKNWTKKNEDNN